MRDSFIARGCFFLGGASLLLAMAIDLVSVLGRRFGFSIGGSLELVQYCIAGVISSAIVVATLTNTHAVVHVITERLSERLRKVLARFSDAIAALFFLAVLAGDSWIAIELWARDERSDLLGLPIAPLRILWCAGLAVSFVGALTVALRRRRGG